MPSVTRATSRAINKAVWPGNDAKVAFPPHDDAAKFGPDPR